MKRRTFIKGAVSAAVAASIPGGDGVELYCARHPVPAYSFTNDLDTGIFVEGGDQISFVVQGRKMHEALARSMMQTKEIVAKNVLGRVFPDDDVLRSPLADDLFVDDSEVHRS